MKQANFSLIFKLGVIIFAVFIWTVITFAPSMAEAADLSKIKIKLQIETFDQTLYNDEFEVTACLSTASSPEPTLNAWCAVEQIAQAEGWLINYSTFGESKFLSAINNYNGADFNWWAFFHNLDFANEALNQYILSENEHILLSYGIFPLRIGVSASTPILNTTSTITLEGFGFDAGWNTVWTPAVSSTLVFGDGQEINNDSGRYELYVSTTSPYIVHGKKNGYLDSPVVSITGQEVTAVNLKLRYQNQFIFDEPINLSSSTVFSYLDTADNLIKSTSTGQNVLGSLLSTDAASSAFNVSEVLYYPSFNSFYLNCLELASPASTTACGNWNYVVDNVYPSLAMDSYALQGGESVNVYFGNPWNITASTSTFPVQTTTTLSAWRYNYDSLDDEWAPDANDLIDISVPNPNPTGLWDATITTTTLTTNASGTIDYIFFTTGTYYAKITSTDFSKWSPAITLTILDAPAASTPENGGDNGGNGGNGGVGSGVPTVAAAVITEKAQAILNFLKSQQSDDGKIIDGGITDWATLSFGADNQYAQDVKKADASLLDFARSYDFTDASELNLCAGYPRHILALLTGGVSGIDRLVQSLVDKIKSSECYSNHQYGQNGINDDVFALLALLSADTSLIEPIITDLAAAVMADQTADGAFTWTGYASPDITGAAVNALSYAKIKGMAIDEAVFTKAKSYLKNQQLADGGWGFGASDALTTSWVMMGIDSLGEGQIEWNNNQNKNPWSVLTSQLNSSGYYEPSWAPGTIDWFGTKHAVPALLGKSWPIILSPKPQLLNLEGGVGGISSLDLLINNASTSTASSTLPLAQTTSTLMSFPTTSTAPIASSSSSLVFEMSPVSSGGSVASEETAKAKAEKPALAKNLVLPSFSSSGKIEAVSQLPVIPTVEDNSSASVSSLQAPIVQPASPLLPLEKKAATTTAAASAVLFGGTTLLLFFRLLLTIV